MQTLSMTAINAKRKRPLTVQQILARVCYKSALGHTYPVEIGFIVRLWINDTQTRYFVKGANQWRETTKDRGENPATWQVTYGDTITKMVATDGDVISERIRSFNKTDAISYHVIPA